ncbi:hypothetical protein [Nonomuraea sp. GTA35]|uniref:hypothetical protein n=1 Tax=Nonomuraea sp. GTA35 TaxID=1676746 RepID=UPI0035C166BF
MRNILNGRLAMRCFLSRPAVLLAAVVLPVAALAPTAHARVQPPVNVAGLNVADVIHGTDLNVPVCGGGANLVEVLNPEAVVDCVGVPLS